MKKYLIYWYKKGKPDIYLGTDGRRVTNPRDALQMDISRLTMVLQDAIRDPFSTFLELRIGFVDV